MKLAPRMRALSLILSLAILFSLVTPVSAATEKKQSPSVTYEQVNQIMIPSDSEQLGGIEDFERREENVKHYIPLYVIIVVVDRCRNYPESNKRTESDDGLPEKSQRNGNPDDAAA